MRLFPILSLACSTIPAGPAVPEVVELAVEGRQVAGETSFHLVNRGTAQARVLPALDGSTEQWRIPKITVAYRDAAGEPVVPRPRSRCGNMNTLRPEHWVTLEPGESLPIAAGFSRLGPPEGAVEAQVTYDTRLDPSLDRPLGDSVPAHFAPIWLADLPKGVWTSPWTPLGGPLSLPASAP